MSQIIEVKVPDIGDFSDVPVIDLFVKVGDSIKVDDAIAKLDYAIKLRPNAVEFLVAKGDLLQYYADVAHVLLPHLRDRAMVMKRYPNGAAGNFFFMKRAPSPRPPVAVSREK